MTWKNSLKNTIFKNRCKEIQKNTSRPLSIKDIEFINNKNQTFLPRKFEAQMTSLVNSFELLRKSNSSLTHFSFFLENRRRNISLFYEFSIILTPPQKNPPQSKSNNPHEKGPKVLSKILANQVQQFITRSSNLCTCSCLSLAQS